MCPECGAPFAAPNAWHSCVRLSLDAHLGSAVAPVRSAFDRLVEIAGDDVAVVAQRTRIVFAAPMRFLAVSTRADRLVGHLFLEHRADHPLIVEQVENAYGSGLVMHRFAICRPEDVDEAFAALVRQSLSRVGRRERLAERRR